MLITSLSPSLNHQSCLLALFLHDSQFPAPRPCAIPVWSSSNSIWTDNEMCSMCPKVTSAPSHSWEGAPDGGAAFLPALLWSPKLRQPSPYWTLTIWQMMYRVIDIIRKKAFNSMLLIGKVKLSQVRESIHTTSVGLYSVLSDIPPCLAPPWEEIYRTQLLLSTLFEHSIYSFCLKFLWAFI